MDTEDDEDSGIELVTVNNYQQRNPLPQLVSLFKYGFIIYGINLILKNLVNVIILCIVP